MTSTLGTATATPPRRLLRTPAFWWALTGIVFTLAGAAVLTPWAVHGVRSPHYSGDSISPARTAVVITVQVLLVIALIACAVHLTRTSLRRGQVTLDAGIAAGFLISSWQSPLFDYRDITIVVNQHVAHVNSWGPYIPGWGPPHPELQIEAPIAVTGVGFGLLILWVWAQAFVGRKIADRFPRWGPLRLWTVIVAAGIVTDALIEAALLNTGVYSYAHAWKPVTLFAGHWYDIPLSAAFTATLFTTPFVVMRHLERTRGAVPWIYRGAELASTARGQNIIRILAGIGAGNVATLVYLVLCVLWGLAGGPMPADTPSYLWPMNAR
ncbi:spirocyclase AveC family protein [Streptomyces sp. LaBMicrA B280]|uniref:spirocyclase AveC family protein n=1 Tax=Streptomyces sp. LaBMicrA B280 TaxID=3391001 RepID=UPI003BA55C64